MRGGSRNGRPQMDGLFHGQFHEKWMMAGGIPSSGHLHMGTLQVTIGPCAEKGAMVVLASLIAAYLLCFQLVSKMTTVWCCRRTNRKSGPTWACYLVSSLSLVGRLVLESFCNCTFYQSAKKCVNCRVSV